MSNIISKVPIAVNEPILTYRPGSKEKKEVLEEYKTLLENPVEIKMRIGDKDVKTGDTSFMCPPHDHQHKLGVYHKANKKNIETAIDCALEAKKKWSKMPWESRAAIFLKAANLVAGPYRSKINAATMIAQSKTIYQAEIDK